MSAVFTFDKRKLDESAERIRQLGNLSAEEVLSRAARIVVRQAILNTPWPRKGGQKSLATQKQLQEKRVGKDINRMFRTVSELGLESDSFKSAVVRAIKAGDSELVAALMGNKNAVDYLAEPTEAAHKKLRFRKHNRYVLMPDSGASKREQFTNGVQKRIFTMKAGWGKAAIGLKMKVPGYLKRHFPGSGRFKVNFGGPSKSIEFENSAKNLDKMRDNENIIGNAMKSAAVRMEKELAIYMSSIGRGDASKVRAKLQREKFVATDVA